MNTSRSILVKDRYDNFVFLFENEFATRWFEEKFPEIKLYSLYKIMIENNGYLKYLFK